LPLIAFRARGMTRVSGLRTQIFVMMMPADLVAVYCDKSL